MSGSDANRRGVRYFGPAAVAALLTCAPIVALYRESFMTFVSAHGLLHTAIADRFMRDWIPVLPENPFFAGARLPYYWFYHYVAAGLAALFGVHPLMSFAALGLAAVALVWLAGAALGRRLQWQPGPSLAIGFLGFAGVNALGSSILLVKLASGKRWPADDGAYLWGLTHPVMGMIRFNDPGALYGPLINFFLNTSSRRVALAVLIVTLLALLRHLQRPGRETVGALTASSALCTAFSPIVGLLAAFSLATGLVVDRLWIARRADGAAGAPFQAAVALVAGCLIPAWTYYHLFVRSGGAGTSIGVRPDILATVGVSAGPLLLLVIVALIGLPSQRRFLIPVTLAGAGLLAGNVLLRLPVSNDSNLFHTGAFMLAVPAAGAFQVIGGRTLRSRLTCALLAIVFASTPLIVLWAYRNRPGVPLAIAADRLIRLPAASPLANTYDWVRTSTAENTVFIVDGRLQLKSILGNVIEFPALSGRSVFIASDPDYMVTLYPDAGRRRAIVGDVIAGHALTADQRQYVAALNRPVLVVVEEWNGDDFARIQTAYGTPVFRDRTVAIFRVIG